MDITRLSHRETEIQFLLLHNANITQHGSAPTNQSAATGMDNTVFTPVWICTKIWILTLSYDQ